MYKKGIAAFPYYVGIGSLAQVATPADRVCVLNILGSESRQVTPVSHAYSRGNVVFGTSPGRKGEVLATGAGDIPVYDNVREGLDAGHAFNTGVVYLPPAGVRDGVAELIRINPDLGKIVILTEKVSVHDAREIRALAQSNGIDIFGSNCLGVADSWNQIRIGGALGGDHPEESLLRGSVALYSNSGNFTTTIAQYLATAGWGTTTLISSGKDVYIHFAAREFAYALANDNRSRAAVMYIEPGGYYEHKLELTKPVVACVVGRWKSKLTRAVGHAGAMAGAGDTAECKEEWFCEAFGVDRVFTPDNPVCSAKGAVVVNIAHIPLAMTEVMALNGVSPDFAPMGDLSLKPWLANNQGLTLPPELDLPTVEAKPSYNEQIRVLRQQLGAQIPRRNMKDCSGASKMDPATQITSVHGHSVLDLALEPLEASFALPLVHEIAAENDRALLDVAVAGEVNLVRDQPIVSAADAAREAGNAPNTIMAVAACMVGPRRMQRALQATGRLIDLFAHSGLQDARDESFDVSGIEVSKETRALFLASEADESVRPQAMLKAVRARGGHSVFLKFIESMGEHIHRDGILAALATTIAWGPLMRKRISRLTAGTLPWYLRLYGVMIGSTIPGHHHQRGSLWGIPREERFNAWTVADLAFLAITGKKPTEAEARPLQVLIGLLISNGPGAISAQGAKGAVSADGPQTPERVQINKAMVGFLTHTGYSHGGNGFEGSPGNGGAPFPIPQNGLEAIWNHLARYRGDTYATSWSQAPVTRGGDYTLVRFDYEYDFHYGNLAKPPEKRTDNKLFNIIQIVTAPARLAGHVGLCPDALAEPVGDALDARAGVIAPRMVVADRAAQRQSLQRPLILRVEAQLILRVPAPRAASSRCSSAGSWVATPTEPELQWHLSSMMQPSAASGAAASCPRAARVAFRQRSM